SLTDEAQLDQMLTMVKEFCNENIADRKKHYFVQLFVEETSVLIVERGFSDGKEHTMDMRIYIDDEETIIRTRDDCKALSMKEKQVILNESDDEDYLGMKLIRGFAKDVHYLPTMNLNNFIISA
ncbi:MAG: ATP-binding protein, partial [Lachnospiraceae bacterium]|nr:ATP-binding protein [Lachnospiraceae bacterium]